MATTVLDTVLLDASQAATAAATLTSNPVAGGVAAALNVAEDVNTSINEAQAQHDTNVQAAAAGIKALTSSASTVTAINALPEADRATATGILAFLDKGWEAFEGLFKRAA